MRYLITGVTSFIIIYILYYVFIVKKQKRYNYKKLPAEVTIFESYYGINVKKIGYKRVMKILNFVNSLMLTGIMLIVLDIKSIYIKLGVIVVIMIPMIWVIYYFVAKYLKHIEGKKE